VAIIVTVLALSGAPQTFAQDCTDNSKLREEIAALKTQVATLVVQQGQTIRAINQLSESVPKTKTLRQSLGDYEEMVKAAQEGVERALARR
jgi:hypothetical protein